MNAELITGAIMALVKSQFVTNVLVPGVITNLATDAAKAVARGLGRMQQSEAGLLALEESLASAFAALLSLADPARVHAARAAAESSLSDEAQGQRLMEILLTLPYSSTGEVNGGWSALQRWFEAVGLEDCDFPEGMADAVAAFAVVFAQQVRERARSLPDLSAQLERSELGAMFQAVQTAAYETELRNRRAYRAYRDSLKDVTDRLPYISLASAGRAGSGRLPLLTEVYVEQHSSDVSPGGEQQGVTTLWEVLGDCRGVVVVQGEPGVGKSTLLRIQTLRCLSAPGESPLSQLVPILVQARKLAVRAGALPDALLAEVKDELGVPLPDQFFLVPPAPQARWLVMVDGLDEVTSPAAYRRLYDHVSTLAKRYPWYLFVVTTRPLPPNDPWRNREFRQLSIRSLDIGQVDVLAEKWFAAIGKPALARPFVQQLLGGPLRGVATNPLMLTMSAIVFERHAASTGLSNRADLYEKFIDIMLMEEETERETWEAFVAGFGKRHLRDGPDVARRLIDERRTLLEALAELRHRGCPGGLSSKAVDVALERGWLSPRFAADRLWAERQMGALLDRTGLLIRRGEDHDFIHMTFQEHLAAAAISRRCSPYTREGEEVLKDWPDPRRRPFVVLVMLLWSLSGVDLTARLQDIPRREEGLALLGAALGQGVKVQERVRRGILADLLRRVEQPDSPVEFRTVVDALAWFAGDPVVVENVTALCKSERLSAVRRAEVATVLGRLGRPTEAAAVLLEIQERLPFFNRLRALRAAHQYGARAEAEAALIGMGTGSERPVLPLKLAEVLLEVGCTREGFAVLRLWARDETIQRDSLKVIRQCCGPSARAVLAEVAADTEYPWYLRFFAALGHSRIASVQESAQLLRGFLTGDDPWRIRLPVAAALARTGAEDGLSHLTHLTQRAAAGPNLSMRLEAALELCSLFPDRAPLVFAGIARDAPPEEPPQRWIDMVSDRWALHRLAFDAAKEIAAVAGRGDEPDAGIDMLAAAWLFQAIGSTTYASECYRKALTLSQDPAILVAAGVAFRCAGRPDEAEPLLRRAFEQPLDPYRTAAVCFHLAEALVAKRHSSEGEVYYRMSLQSCRSLGAAVGLASVLCARGETEQARRELLVPCVHDDAFLTDFERVEHEILRDLILGKEIELTAYQFHRVPGNHIYYGRAEEAGPNPKWGLLAAGSPALDRFHEIFWRLRRVDQAEARESGTMWDVDVVWQRGRAWERG